MVVESSVVSVVEDSVVVGSEVDDVVELLDPVVDEDAAVVAVVELEAVVVVDEAEVEEDVVVWLGGTVVVDRTVA
ncbi:MAG: hypothetical protein OEW83_04525 [Acidimicrobiia bacterium]|nr:hypothetical protein [Acidimicrobiia bacterium]